EDDRVDRDAGRVGVVLGDVGHVGQVGGEAAVGGRPGLTGLLGRALGDGVALPVQPAVDVGRRVLRAALPPDLTGPGVVGEVGEEGAATGLDRVQRTRVGLLVGVLGHAEDAVLGVEAVDAARLLVDPRPGDVVAVELDVVAVAAHVGGQGHRQV